MTPFAIHYNNEWLRSYNANNIYTELKGDVVGDYWGDRQSPGISKADNTFFTIDWEAYLQCAKSLPFGIKLFLSKGLSSFAATGQYMAKIYQAPSKCPRCNTEENFPHIISCHDADAEKVWRLHIQQALNLIERHINPAAAQITKQYLLSWREDIPLSNHVHIPQELKGLFEAQDKLGWYAFCVGRLSHQWSLHTTSTDAHNNPRRWVHLLIQSYA